MKNMKKRLGALILALSLISSFGAVYADEPEEEYADAEMLENAETYSADEDGIALLADVPADAKVMFECYGESEDELKTIKKSSTNVSITNDYAASGTGSVFVEVTGAYGSMQFPFDIEKGKLYKLTYAACSPNGSGDIYLQGNIYAQPQGAHQGNVKLQPGVFNRYTKIIYYPDKEFSGATYGFYCNNVGDKFLLDDVVMLEYDDFGVSKTSYFYDGVKNVDVTGDICLKLNYDIDRNNIGNIKITDEDGNETEVASIDVMDSNTLVIQHDVLKNDKEYTLTIDSVKDTVGRTAKDLTVNFTTVEEVTVNSIQFDKDSLEEGKIGLTGTLENHSLNEKTVTVKIWLYDGLSMVQRVSVPVTIGMFNTETLDGISIDVPELPGGEYTLAASVWEDDTSKRPLCKSIGKRDSNH